MKRLLSWVVLVLIDAVCALAYRTFYSLFAEGVVIDSTTFVLWALFVVLTIAYVYFGAKADVALSQKVFKSKAGARYKIFGGLIAAINILSMLSVEYRIDTLQLSYEYRTVSYLEYGIIALHGLFLISIGSEAAHKE